MKNIEDMNDRELEACAKLIKIAKNNTKWEKLGCLNYRKIGKITYIKYGPGNIRIDDNIKLEQLVIVDRIISDSDLKIESIDYIWFGCNFSIKDAWNFKFVLPQKEGCLISLCGCDLYVSLTNIDFSLKIGSLSDPDVFKNVLKTHNITAKFSEKFSDMCLNPQKYYQKILKL